MPLEVRQLTIRSSVDPAPDAEEERPLPEETLERLKAEVLAECKAWLEEKMQRMRER
jgi:hypothetical protein